MGEKERQRERLAFLLSEKQSILEKRNNAVRLVHKLQRQLKIANREADRIERSLSFINGRIEEESDLLNGADGHEQ